MTSKDRAVLNFMQELIVFLKVSHPNLCFWPQDHWKPFGLIQMLRENELHVGECRFKSAWDRFWYLTTFRSVPFVARTMSLFGNVFAIYVPDSEAHLAAKQLFVAYREQYPKDFADIELKLG